MQIEVNNVKITLTEEQLAEISRQTKKSKPITKRINDFGDVLNELNSDGIILPFSNPKTKEQKSINALYKLFAIAEAYNEGTILDWKDSNQYKYTPYKYFSNGSWVVFVSDYWHSILYFPASIYFKSRELAEDALKKFRNIYDDFWMI